MLQRGLYLLRILSFLFAKKNIRTSSHCEAAVQTSNRIQISIGGSTIFILVFLQQYGTLKVDYGWLRLRIPNLCYR